MIPNVYEMLNVAAVNAHVETRIFGAGHAGDSPAYPYITWQVISGAPENYQGQAPNVDNARVQINIWARDEASCRTTATAARDVLDTHGHQALLMGPERDPETKSYRIQMDYSFWTDR